MRIRKDEALEAGLEEAVAELGADGGKELAETEGVCRIAVVDPAVHREVHEDDALRGAARVKFEALELELVENGEQALAVKSLAAGLLEGLADDAAAGIGPVRGRVADRDAGHQLLERGRVEVDVVTEPRVQQGLLERGLVGAGEVVGKHVEDELRLAVREGREDPAVLEDDAAVLDSAFVTDRFPARDGTLKRNLRLHFGAVVAGKDAVELGEDGREVEVAIQEDAGVRRMIVLRVESLEGIKGELRDMSGIAAGDEAVAGVGEEESLESVERDGVGTCERALHLGVDDARARQRTVPCGLVVPALLVQHPGFADATRIEDGVKIDLNEIGEVPRVAGRDGVAGEVWPRGRVEVGRHRALEQLDERLLDGEASRAAEDGMLEDVRHARIVLGRRAEGDAEGLVLLGAGEPDEVRPVLLVRHPHEPRADVR